MATTRIYQVRNRETGTVRLVECGHRNTALRHVALQTFEVSTITAAALRRLQEAGTTVEDIAKNEQLEVEQEASEEQPAEVQP